MVTPLVGSAKPKFVNRIQSEVVSDDGVNDTLLVDACLIKLHLHFVIDKLGQAIS